MKVILAGSRGITDFGILDQVVAHSKYFVSEVVSGGARGVDQLGEQWAKIYNHPVRQFLPDWSLGKGAGHIRNKQMAEYADALVAIWDGESRGTKNMIETMQKLGKPVFVYTPKD